MDQLLRFASMYLIAATWEEGEEYEDYLKRVDEEIFAEHPNLRPRKDRPSYEEEFRQSIEDRRRTTEDVLREEALSMGRDPDLEIQAYRNRDIYYSRPGLAETRQGELREEVKKTRRAPEDIISQWAEEAGRDPETELELMKSRTDQFGTRKFPREHFRSLWVIMDLVDSDGEISQPIVGKNPPDIKRIARLAVLKKWVDFRAGPD